MAFPPLPPGLRTRIAPTPSGLLHRGNGASFLLTARLAQAAEGSVLLRIDDLDGERARPEYIADIFDTLEWLGVAWQRGPHTPEEFREEWSQHHRIARYLGLVGELRTGGHLYACDCSRSAIAARGIEGYDGHCRERGLPFDAPDVAWRLRIPAGTTAQGTEWVHGERRWDLSALVPDPVVRQRNGRPSYQIASLADDVDHGIDFIVRGKDLLPSTACQLYIASLLGLGDFGRAVFLHHPLLLDPSGGKLSKSRGSDALRTMREAGEGPHAILRSADELLTAYLRRD